MKQELLANFDFLAITRANEDHLASVNFTLDNGTDVAVWDTGVIVFEPSEQKGTDVVLSSGVHGNETAPMEIVNQLIAATLKGELILKQRVMFMFGNPRAVNIGKRFVDENMNRMFSGAHGIKDDPFKAVASAECPPERIRAAKLEHYIQRFFNGSTHAMRCHYDLHTAIRGSKREKFAIYPFPHGKPWRKSEFELLQACGVSTVLLMPEAATTFAYYSSRHANANALTIELGKVLPFGQNDMSRFAQAKETLTRLITGQAISDEAFDLSKSELFHVYKNINRDTEAFRLNVEDDVKNFTDFPMGYVLAEDKGVTHTIDKPGEVIVFPNANVQMGHRALMTVIPADISDQVE